MNIKPIYDYHRTAEPYWVSRGRGDESGRKESHPCPAKTLTGSNTLISTSCALRRETHTPAGRDISAKREHAAAHSKNETERRRAQLAETLKDLRK